MSELLDKIMSLEEKYKEREELTKALTKSLKIQQIWPEAFDAGGCTFKHRRLRDGTLDAFLERPDGVKHTLSEEEYTTLTGRVSPKQMAKQREAKRDECNTSNGAGR